MSFNAIEIANILNEFILSHLAIHPIGRTRVEQSFYIPVEDDESRIRRPDVAFISYARLPKAAKIPRRGHAIDGVVPELAVEVISPTEPARDAHRKVLEYLNAGVKLVWMILPEIRQVYAYTGPKTVRIFAVDDTLDGGEILPGFTVPVADLFPETDDEPAGN